MNRRAFVSLTATLALLGLAPVAQAQDSPNKDWPSKPVRIVVDSAAGSANDVTVRILAEKLGKIWNQQVLTLNQPGAGGSVATRVAASSPADGYTFFLPATSSFLAIAGGPGVAPNLPIVLPRDFLTIGFVLLQPIFIGVSPHAPFKTVPELIAAAKAKPGEITYAATGRGRLTHLTMLLLQQRAGIQLQLVPYAGGPAQAMNDVMSGRVPLVLDAYAGLAPALKGKLINGFAVSSDRRLKDFPDLPPIAETLPGFLVGAWNVMLAPNGTPDAIVKKASADLKTALEDPEVADRIATFGGYAKYLPPDETIAFTLKEQETWRPIMEQVAREAQ